MAAEEWVIIEPLEAGQRPNARLTQMLEKAFDGASAAQGYEADTARDILQAMRTRRLEGTPADALTVQKHEAGPARDVLRALQAWKPGSTPDGVRGRRTAARYFSDDGVRAGRTAAHYFTDAETLVRALEEAKAAPDKAKVGSCTGDKADDRNGQYTAAAEKRILFVISLPAEGINLEAQRLLRLLRGHMGLLEGFVGGVIVDGQSDLYTKSTAVQLVFSANQCGCAFVGRPLVEATGDLRNFTVTAVNLGTSLTDAYAESVRMLVKKMTDVSTGDAPCENAPSPRLLALHASSHRTSNTYALWHAVKKRLSGILTEEVGLRNGTLYDCSGCPYRMCLHYGERDSCFYGGVMVEDVYPRLREADAILMICPNYNDALSANLTAFINRLTALYRKEPFTNKALFAIVVSGYSGSDIVASQLIAALNMNKSFYLPAYFAMLETANDPGAAMRLPGIEARIDAFAARIRATLSGTAGKTRVRQG